MSKKQDLKELVEKGGQVPEIYLLRKIFELREDLEKTKKELEDGIIESKTGVPDFSELVESIKTLAEKETPAPIVNIPETRVEVQSPIVNIQPPNIEVSAPNVSVPPPIVNVKGERVELDETTKQAILDLQNELEALKKDHSKLKEQRPMIFGPGKTKLLLLDISSQLDGVTKTFAVGNHFGIVGVWGSSSPFAFRPSVDYTAVGKNIVFDAAIDAGIALAEGQTLLIQYLK